MILKTLELSDNPILNNDINSTTIIMNQFILQLSKRNKIDDTSIVSKTTSILMKLNGSSSSSVTTMDSLNDTRSSLDTRKFIQFLNSMTIEQNNLFLREKLERDDDDDSWSDNILKSLNRQLILLTHWSNSNSTMKKEATFIIKYNKEEVTNDDDNDDKEVTTTNDDDDDKRFYMTNLIHVIKIQASFRGYTRRKQLKKVMLSSRYIDNDIEEILMNDDFIDDMNLDESPELHNNWFANRDSKWLNEKEYENTMINDDDDDDDVEDNNNNNDNNNDDDDDDETKDNKLNENGRSSFDNYYNSNTNAMAYGDHIRRRQNNNSGGGLRTLSADHPTIQIEDFKENLSRPSTGMTSASTVTTTSKAYSEQDDEFLSKFRKEQNVDEIAKEWGVSNPKVAAMIMKRNKRMKGFQQAAKTREKEKSSSERFDRFVRTNIRLNSNTAK